MGLESILYYVRSIGRIISIGISVMTMVWSVISVVKVLVERMKLAVEEKDFSELLDVIDEFVIGMEQKYSTEDNVGAKKKEEVIKLLESAGYSFNEVIDALIESAVHRNFHPSSLEEVLK